MAAETPFRLQTPWSAGSSLDQLPATLCQSPGELSILTLHFLGKSEAASSISLINQIYHVPTPIFTFLHLEIPDDNGT